MTFVLVFILSFIRPLWVVMFIIVLSTLWLVRVVYFVFYLIVSWRQYSRAQAINWDERLRAHHDWESIVHAIILPTYTEPIEVLDRSIQSFVQSQYPHKQLVVVLAGESRDESFQAIAHTLQQRYQNIFRDIIITIHPSNLPGEIPAKGANANWAGKTLEKYCVTNHIPIDSVIVSYFDSDTCTASNYFTMLTSVFLDHPDRYRTAYQPIAVYANNIWHSPFFTRVSAFSTTFWLMAELARPERLYTFSSHAMSLRALVDVGFWQSDIVTDDSRIFLQCYLHYHGRFTVTPLYSIVSMDTAMSSTIWKSMTNLYRQQRRWAYGVEHFPYLAWHFRNEPSIPLSERWKFLWKLIEGSYTWATTPLLLFIFGHLPLIVLRHQVTTPTILQVNAPIVLQWLMGLAMVGIIVSVMIELRLLPERPASVPAIKFVEMLLQWVALPISLIVFGCIPAAEAQTRLMLGRYLGFHVTEKIGLAALKEKL